MKNHPPLTRTYYAAGLPVEQYGELVPAELPGRAEDPAFPPVMLAIEAFLVLAVLLLAAAGLNLVLFHYGLLYPAVGYFVGFDVAALFTIYLIRRIL